MITKIIAFQTKKKQYFQNMLENQNLKICLNSVLQNIALDPKLKLVAL